MAEQTSNLRDINADVDRAIDQVKEDVDQLIEGLDVNQMTRRIEEFGRSNPVGLAVASLALGVAAGLLMRRSSNRSS